MKQSRESRILLLFVLTLAGFAWFAFRLANSHIAIPAFTTIFTMLLLAPVGEELFFRGVLQDMIKSRVNGAIFYISFANIITSVFFAAAHIAFWGMPHAALVFVPSLAFGLLYERSGNIVFPIILHAIYNLNIFIA